MLEAKRNSYENKKIEGSELGYRYCSHLCFSGGQLRHIMLEGKT
jgi:hypothetical protein